MKEMWIIRDKERVIIGTPDKAKAVRIMDSLKLAGKEPTLEYRPR